MAVKLVTDSALNKAMNMLTGDRDIILNVYDPAAGRRQVAFSDELPTAEEKAAWNDSDVFIATYGTTTSAEIEAAYQAGKAVFMRSNKVTAPLYQRVSASIFVYLGGHTSYICNSDAWSNSNVSYTPSAHASTHATGGDDPITPASIGAATMGEVNSAIQSAIGSAIGGSY